MKAVYGIRCHLIRTIVEWKYIFILMWPMDRWFFITWGSHRKRGISWLAITRQLYHHPGAFIQAAAPAIMVSSGAWRERTWNFQTWMQWRLRKSGELKC